MVTMDLRLPVMKTGLVLAKLNDEPEIFHSLQGEGISLGLPSIFVRCSGCNLQCNWCDTEYTWNWTGTSFAHLKDRPDQASKYDRQAVQIRQSPEEVAAAVKRFPCRNVVLTGGEPMLQQQQLTEVCRLLRASDPEYEFEVETNGTLRPDPEFDHLINRYNVSPKLLNSGMPRSATIIDDVLKWFAATPKATFKFVCRTPDDAAEIAGLQQQFQLPKPRIFVMPEAWNQQTLQERRQAVFELCLQHGWRYTDRLHVAVFGDRRGI